MNANLQRLYKDLNTTIDGYSIWNSEISFDTLAGHINTFMSPGIPIFSVGSGNGKFEKHYNDKYTGNDIICVDPKSNEFNGSEVILEPKYTTVEHLISERPEVVENSQALLIWTPPSSKYDMDVFKKLKSKRVLVVWEKDGSAGSYDFHTYMEEACDSEYTTNELLIKYRYRPSPFGSDYYTITAFERV